MRPTRLWYKRLFNMDKYQHEEIGDEVEIGEGETATQALTVAKNWVEGENEKKKVERKFHLKEARIIVDNPDDYTGGRVKRAEETIRALSGQPEEDEIPF